jgi:hypothetical protein
MPPPEGIPLLTSPLALNMSEGVLRKWLELWPCTGPLSDIPYSCLLEGSCRTPVEGQLSIPQGLQRAQSPLFLRLEVSIHRPLFLPVGARLFRREAKTAW